MFYNPNNYPFLKKFEDNIDVIKAELNAALTMEKKLDSIFYPQISDIDYYTDYWVKDNGFHPDQIGYDIRVGEYSTFAIFKKNFPVKLFDVNVLFPKTIEMLNSVPNLYYSGFFKMSPKTELLPHTHTRSHLIFHLLLENLENGECILSCENETAKLKNAGDSALFNYGKNHGSINTSETDRINFIIDFNPMNT